MANHVYFDCHIDQANDSSADEIGKIFDAAESFRIWKGYDGKEHKMKEWDAGKLSIYPVPYDENDWYEWGCQHMGAKWVSIDDVDIPHFFSGHSAWSPIIPLVENLMQTVFERTGFEDLVMTLSYEDEFRNFIGVAEFEIVDGSVQSHINEVESDELNSTMCEAFGKDQNWIDDEDFEWDNEYEIVESNCKQGDKWTPSEYIDELVYNFKHSKEIELL